MTCPSDTDDDIEVCDTEAIPDRVTSKRKRYPFDKLTRMGMSFKISHDKSPNVASLRSAASYYSSRHGVGLAVEDTPEYVRVWRVG